MGTANLVAQLTLVYQQHKGALTISLQVSCKRVGNGVAQPAGRRVLVVRRALAGECCLREQMPARAYRLGQQCPSNEAVTAFSQQAWLGR